MKEILYPKTEKVQTRNALKGASAVLVAAGLTLSFAGAGAMVEKHENNPAPQPKTIETIITSDRYSVDIKDLKIDFENAYKNNHAANKIYPSKYFNANFAQCQVGINGTDRRESGKAQCGFLVDNAFDVYQETGDEAFYKAAESSYNFALNRYGVEGYQQDLNGFLRKSRIEEIINSEPKEVSAAELKAFIEKIYQANPNAENIYPKEESIANFVHAQVGFNGTDRRESGKAQSKVLMDRTMDVYAQTGQPEAFEALNAEYNFSINRYPGFKPQLDLHLESLGARK